MEDRFASWLILNAETNNPLSPGGSTYRHENPSENPRPSNRDAATVPVAPGADENAP